RQRRQHLGLLARLPAGRGARAGHHKTGDAGPPGRGGGPTCQQRRPSPSRASQAEGAAPLVTGEPFPDPETKATAIRIGNPASWKLAEEARDESGGRFESVSDAQILAAQKELASRDGVFVEPASAAGIAGMLQDIAERDSYVCSSAVVTVTAHGLKDTGAAPEGFGSVVDVVVDADVTAAA